MLFVMAGVFIAIGVVLYAGFLRSPSTPAVSLAPLPVSPLRPEEILQPDDIAIVEDQRFRALKVPSGIPVRVPVSGRANPFAPAQ